MDNKDITIGGSYADDTITITDIDLSGLTIAVDNTIDLTSMASTCLTANSLNYNYGNVTISNGTSGFGAQGSSGSYLYTNGTNGYTFTNPNSGSLSVHGDAEFDGDIKWKGRSLGKMLEDIEKRLAILVPDPEKLEHFVALKKAYEHYKTLEALCEIPKKEEKE